MTVFKIERQMRGMMFLSSGMVIWKRGYISTLENRNSALYDSFQWQDGGLESRKSKADSKAFTVLRLGELSFFETHYLGMGQFIARETQSTTVTREDHQTSTHEHSKLK